MRKTASNDAMTGLAVAGNHVVLLGWNLAAESIRQARILGFAIQRTRSSDGERIWLGSMKTFRSVEPNPAPGVPVSSREHPLQTFQWADYSVTPDRRYDYRVVAMAGTPGALVEGPSLTFAVRTEPVDRGRHAVFFNRGAIASQEYARRFQNRPPSEVGQAAYDWLSRGLVEGLENYIAAAGQGDELLGAFFEFTNERIFTALKAANARGAAVTILYDADSQRVANEAAIAASGMAALVEPRARSGSFAHNKFLVLRRRGVAEQVWTGSTNLSENGIYGHSNNAHLLRDRAVAMQYERYWRLLRDDRTRKPTATGVEALSAAPLPGAATPAIQPVFSPRLALDALDAYARMAHDAKRAVFTTFAFGMDERFVRAYEQRDAVLRFALMEKKGSGQRLAAQSAEVDRIRRLPNVTVAVGNSIRINAFDRWLGEIDRIRSEVNVRFVHTKYMLVDPLGPAPVLVMGSANFSQASTTTNDENMLVVRGERAVADIYLGEFMRLFTHYAFRESLAFKGDVTPVTALLRKHLVESADWIDAGYFSPGTDRALRRAYFSGN